MSYRSSGDSWRRMTRSNGAECRLTATKTNCGFGSAVGFGILAILPSILGFGFM